VQARLDDVASGVARARRGGVWGWGGERRCPRYWRACPSSPAPWPALRCVSRRISRSPPPLLPPLRSL